MHSFLPYIRLIDEGQKASYLQPPGESGEEEEEEEEKIIQQSRQLLRTQLRICSPLVFVQVHGDHQDVEQEQNGTEHVQGVCRRAAA